MKRPIRKLISLRLPPELLAWFETWCRKHKLTRTEGIEKLMEDKRNA